MYDIYTVLYTTYHVLAERIVRVLINVVIIKLFSVDYPLAVAAASI